MLDALGKTLALGDLLDVVSAQGGGYELVTIWTEGDYHHDLLLKVAKPHTLPGPFLVVSANCNGGVKAIKCLNTAPEDRDVLWQLHCPSGAFDGEIPEILAEVKTVHWFDPAVVKAAYRGIATDGAESRRR